MIRRLEDIGAEITARTDSYFNRTKQIVSRYGDKRVTYALFLRRPVICAPRLMLDWLKTAADRRGTEIEVDLIYQEGDWVGAGEPIVYLTGSLVQLSDLETILLQKIGPSCVAAHNAYQMALSLPGVAFLAMEARHCAGAGVEIFVGTPHREIDIPVVQRQRHVADRVSEIDTDRDTSLLRCFRDRRDVKQLAGEKIHAGNHNHGERIAILFDKIDNVLGAHGEFAFARTGENECGLRIKSMMHDLRFDRVGVGGERRFFHQDFEARLSGTIKGRHHQVQIHRQAVHADHFDQFRAHHARDRFA